MNPRLTAPTAIECEPEWQSRPVSELATHISGTYHERMRDQLPFLIRQTAGLIPRFSDGRVFLLRALVALLVELQNEADSHTWIEDDVLFPVLAAHDNPVVLGTTLTPERLLRLVAQLSEEHEHIRQVLARITAHIAVVSERAAGTPEWVAVIQRVEQLRDLKLQELDLEDRCLLPRARAIADAERQLWAYR